MSSDSIMNIGVSSVLPADTTTINNNYQSITGNRRLPFIIGDYRTRIDNVIQLENKKHKLTTEHFPVIGEFITEDTNIFGPLNEVEYSTNILFKNVTINPAPNAHVTEHIRYYFNSYTRLYVNSSRLSTEYLVDGRHVDVKIITRVDYVADRNGAEALVVDDISVKLKLIKEDFRYNEVSYRLAGSIEVPLPEFKPMLLDGYSKRRQFKHWMLGMTHRTKYLVFRVAFRKEREDSNDYTCNIECECQIEPASFIECADLLYKYYKQQYIVNNGCIQPLYEYTKIPVLTKDQQNTLKTFAFIDNKSYVAENESNTDKNAQTCFDLIKYLGLQAFMSYVPDILKHQMPRQLIRFYNLNWSDTNNSNFIDFENCNVTFDDLI